MNKVTRLDSRRDAEAIELAQELSETEAWFHSKRFRHITRLHTPYEVVALRGGLIDRALCALIRGETAPGTGDQCNSWLRSKVDVERLANNRRLRAKNGALSSGFLNTMSWTSKLRSTATIPSA